MFNKLTHQELVNLAELLYRANGNALDAMRQDRRIGFTHPICVMAYEFTHLLDEVSDRHSRICMTTFECPSVTL